MNTKQITDDQTFADVINQQITTIKQIEAANKRVDEIVNKHSASIKRLANK